MLEMIVAPAGGAGALPPPLGVGVGVGAVGVVLPELGDPEALEPVNWFVVVPVEEVLAFETPHPVHKKMAIDNVPMAQNPFRFNCIRDLSVGGGADLSGQIRGASTLDISGEACRWVKEFALVAS
jgi:hypothetical protein